MKNIHGMLEQVIGFDQTSLLEEAAIKMELHYHNTAMSNGEKQYLHPHNSADYIQNAHLPYSVTPDSLIMFPQPTSSNSPSLFGELVPPSFDGCFDPLTPLMFHSVPCGVSFDSQVFEFKTGETDHRDGRRNTKQLGTERQRRHLINHNFEALRKLIPNPTKNDLASILGDAINYINELKNTVSEHKDLLEKKRCAKERFGNTEVDVKIIEDQVTVKLVHHKRINCCLALVSKVLDEFQLDLHHVAGGLIGDHYSFLFNSKNCEGSIVHSSSLANKLIEVLDEQRAGVFSSINRQLLLPF